MRVSEKKDIIVGHKSKKLLSFFFLCARDNIHLLCFRFSLSFGESCVLTVIQFRNTLPQLIVPFFGDQLFWGKQIHKLRLGACIHHKDLTGQLFYQSVLRCSVCLSSPHPLPQTPTHFVFPPSFSHCKAWLRFILSHNPTKTPPNRHEKY